MTDREGFKSLQEIRREAEAKRIRDQADTDAALKEFKDSFGDGDDDDEQGAAETLTASTSRRHFAVSSSRRTGPGTLGPSPSELAKRKPFGLGPPPSQPPPSASESNQHREVKPGKPVVKPVLELTCLPSSITDLGIRHIFGKGNLVPDSVRIVDPDDLESTRKDRDKISRSALAFFDVDTSSRDLDEFTKKFNNFYVGVGYYMFVNRSDTNSYRRIPTHSSMQTNPFGAVNYKPPPPPEHYATSQQGPHQGGIAPPSSFRASEPKRPNNAGRIADAPIVVVKIPSDYRQMQMIHDTVENLLAAPDEKAFEDGLKASFAVQADEKWAWLFDPRSTGGVYYHWRVWELKTGYAYTPQRNKRNKTELERLHKVVYGQHFPANMPLWREPDPVPFEFCQTYDDLVNDPAYDSSDPEDNDDAGYPRPKYWELSPERPDFLNKYETARLLWLLRRLPKTHMQLERGDVMTVTDFAIDHAGFGGWQIVKRLVENVLQPFNSRDDSAEDEIGKQVDKDTSPAQLVALHIISDLVANCTDPDAKNAWRYRPELSEALLGHHVFFTLGCLPSKFDWGRVTEERWRNQVTEVLAFWREKSMFDLAPLAEMKASFERGLKKQKDGKGDHGSEENKERKAGGWTVVGKQHADEDTPMPDK